MSEGSNVASTSSYVFPAAPGPAGPMGDTFTGETSSAAAAATAGVSPSAADVVFDNDARHPNFFKLHQEQLEARRAHAEIQKAKLSAVRLSKKDAKGISGGRLKRYMCTWPDCGKAYTRPTRLAEHQRTHTGERPYPCLYCAATFSRESHRKAHTRIHRDDSERNCYCPVEGCGMVFWTNQHLKKHMEGKHGDPKPPKYFCTQCDEGFRQRKMLRTHTMEVHGPPDAKPYPCMHPGCDKTFSQFAHVRSHMKTHDLSRYACIHPDCAGLGDEANQFGTWSALQKHTKAMHPPVCPHEECNGRTFTTRRGLRYHLDSHTRKQQRAEARMARDALTAAMYGRTADDVPEDEHDGHFASTSAAAKRVAPFAAGAGSPKTRKKAKPNYAENSDDDGPTFDDLYGDDAGFSPAAPEQEDEDDDFRSDMGDSDDEIEEGVVWLAQQDAERDDRMREDFRHGGKRKRKVLREADGFPPLLLPIPPPPLARRDASPPLERLPTPPPNIMGTPLVIPDQAPQQSLYLDLVTGANYSPATSVPPPPVPPAASNSGAAEPSAPLEDQAAADAAPVTKARPLLARKFPCPYPAILSLPHTSLRPVPQEGEEPKKKQKRQRARFPFRTPLPEGMEPIEGMSADDDESDAEDGDGLCKFWFKRVYDVERHLKSKHKIVLEGGRTPLNVWFASETTAETPIATE